MEEHQKLKTEEVEIWDSSFIAVKTVNTHYLCTVLMNSNITYVPLPLLDSLTLLEYVSKHITEQ